MKDAVWIAAGGLVLAFEKKEQCGQMARHNAKGMNDANDWIVPVCGKHGNLACFDGGQQFRHKRSGAVPDYTILPACRRTYSMRWRWDIKKTGVVVWRRVGYAPVL